MLPAGSLLNLRSVPVPPSTGMAKTKGLSPGRAMELATAVCPSETVYCVARLIRMTTRFLTASEAPAKVALRRPVRNRTKRSRTSL